MSLSPWARRKQMLILGGILVLGILVFSVPVYKHFNQPATCTDGKKNADERGIDCGGHCKNFCQFETTPLVVKWSRAFKITDGVYTLFAYVENQNRTASAKSFEYEFKIYDATRKLIARKTGTSFVSANGVQPIVETGIQVGQAVPQFTSFTITKEPYFIETPGVLLDLATTVTNPVFASSPRQKLEAVAKNISTTTAIIRPVYTAVLYDSDDNAIAVSETQFQSIGPSDEKNLIFTWPQVFERPVVRSEIISRFDPFSQAKK